MKKFLVALCALAGFSFGSMIGMEALGEEQVQG
jgi:long-chain fatty acid transport protein